jgi:hypothetical protein
MEQTNIILFKDLVYCEDPGFMVVAATQEFNNGHGPLPKLGLCDSFFKLLVNFIILFPLLNISSLSGSIVLSFLMKVGDFGGLR